MDQIHQKLQIRRRVTGEQMVSVSVQQYQLERFKL